MRGLIHGPILGALCAVTLAACGDDGGAADAGSVDAVPTADAVPAADAPPPADAGVDALIVDAALLEPGATCQNPILLNPGEGATVDTLPLNPTGRGSCRPASSQARDAVLRFEIGATPKDLLITAATDEGIMMPFDVVLYARGICTSAAEELGCFDSGWGESGAFLDVSGSVFVFIDGSHQFGGNNHGTATVTSAVRDIVATDGSCDMAGVTSRCAAGNRCVASTCVADSAALACSQATDMTSALSTTGSFSATGTTQQYDSDFYKGSCPFDTALASPEAIFQFTVTAASTFVATTDLPGTGFDTYLYLRQGTCDGTELACHDDVDLPMQNLRSTISIADLQPGTYYLFVDGSSPGQNSGDYQLDVTLTAN